MAKSRRPTAVRRSQLANSRATSELLTPFGGESERLVADGTVAASAVSVKSSTNRKRSSDRNLDVVRLGSSGRSG